MNIPDTILAATVGAALALFGTLVSQLCGLISSQVDRKHHTKVRRKQNLENVVDLIGRCDNWRWELMNSRALSEIQRLQPPTEIRQVLMVARLSFPSIVAPAVRWGNAHVDFYNRASLIFQADGTALGSQLETLAIQNPEMSSFHALPSEMKRQLDDAVAEEAKKYVDL